VEACALTLDKKVAVGSIDLRAMYLSTIRRLRKRDSLTPTSMYSHREFIKPELSLALTGHDLRIGVAITG